MSHITATTFPYWLIPVQSAENIRYAANIARAETSLKKAGLETRRSDAQMVAAMTVLCRMCGNETPATEAGHLVWPAIEQLEALGIPCVLEA